MTVTSIARFERFFRAAAGLNVDKNDLKRYTATSSTPSSPIC